MQFLQRAFFQPGIFNIRRQHGWNMLLHVDSESDHKNLNQTRVVKKKLKWSESHPLVETWKSKQAKTIYIEEIGYMGFIFHAFITCINFLSQ